MKKEQDWAESPEVDIARRLAVEALYNILKKNKKSEDVIDFFIRKYKLKGTIRSFFTNLVYGTLRTMGTIDYVIRIYTRKRLEKMDFFVRIILRLGVFQIFYLNSVPDYAAVDESVELTRTMKRMWADGLVNAVLRAITAEKSFIKIPDFKEDPVKHIAMRHSYQNWMAEKIVQEYGKEEGHLLAKGLNEISPLTIRVNTLKKSPESVFFNLKRKYRDVERGRYLKEAIKLRGVSSNDLRFYLKPQNFHIQDEGSMLISLLLRADKGDKILDMCSAPGGKTSHIAEITENEAEIYAADKNERKINKMKMHMKEMGVQIKKYMVYDLSRKKLPLEEGYFDRVLLDAPCSSSGTIRRNPEIKWRLNQKLLEEFSELQLRLLYNAFKLTRRKGIFVYSTCSLFREENEQVVEKFLDEKGDEVEILEPLTGISHIDSKIKNFINEKKYFKLLSHRSGTDCFFAVVFRKK